MNDSASNLESQSGAAEKELCRGCLAPNEPEAPFCKACGAPLSSYASTAPFESVFAEGHVYRSAVERPHKPIVLLGIWVLFGCLGLTGALFIYLGFASEGLYSALMGLFMVGVSCAIIFRTTRNYFLAGKSTSLPADS